METIYTIQSERPVPCVDILVFNEKNEILLIQREKDPYNEQWSIIGGRVEVFDDNIESAALREIKEETGFDAKLESLVGILSQPDRNPPADPRFFIVQTIFTARYLGGTFILNDETKNVAWVSLEEAMSRKLAFNHNDILELYVEKKHTLISRERTYFSEYFGKEYIYNETNGYVRFATNAIIVDGQKRILLAQRNQRPYSGDWDFPGGHMHVGESIQDCLLREVKEELGVSSELGELFGVYSDRGKSSRAADVVSFYFATISDTHFSKNIEMKDFRFFPFEELPTNIAYHNEGPLSDIARFLGKTARFISH